VHPSREQRGFEDVRKAVHAAVAGG
jgi:hypothetical protein